MLTLDDFLMLYAPMAREVERLLPLPGTVAFYALTGDGVFHPLAEHLFGEQSEGRSGPIQNTAELERPRIADDQLIMPLPVADDAYVAIVVDDIDPAFLQKMSMGWLRELREVVLDRLSLLRDTYIDPETGLYNSRAATAFLFSPEAASFGFFFLLHTVFTRRDAAGNLQKNRENAELFLALSRGLCCSFGYGIFGGLLPLHDKKRALRRAHSLQRRFRQEGLTKVQIGFASIAASGEHVTAETVLKRWWRALAIAEKRGPFGICDLEAAELGQREHPFRLPATWSLRPLRKMYRGRSCFTLVLLDRRNIGTVDDSFSSLIEDILAGSGQILGQDGNLVLLGFPDSSQDAVRRTVESLAAACADRYGQGRVSMGIAAWPCLDFTKGEVAGNCLKALRHGDFSGPGSVTFFDYLTLNISGDYFFDEGDYQAALREYRRGLRLRPGDINLTNSLGVTLVECGQERRAAQCFQAVLQQEPENYMALINLGHVRNSLGEKTVALGCFERAYHKTAADEAAGVELFLPLGRLYAEQGAHDRAIAVLERWRNVPGCDQDFLLFRALGHSYHENGQPEEAIRSCQRALQLFPQDSVSMSLLGLLYVEQDQGHDLGLSLCNRAVEQDRFNAGHWHRLARALLHAGQAAAALEAVRQSLHLHHNNPEALLCQGRICQLLGKSRQARNAYQRVLRLKGRTPLQEERAREALDALANT
jgi:tetratricopeptide (TPR) repeat protein